MTAPAVPINAGSGSPESDSLLFDTIGMTPDAAFERYRELYGVGTDALRLGPDFSAKVEAWRLDRMLLFHRRLNDVGHRRDAKRTRSDGFNHFTATLLLGGKLEVDGDNGGHFRPTPGEVLLVNTHWPNTNRMYHAHVVTLSVARERMAAIAGNVNELHGLILTADQARLFREFVESLLRNLPTMSRDATMAAAGVLTALLMIAIDNSGTVRRSATSTGDLERLGRLKRLIDARIADPAFGTDMAIREAGLSRATVYRLLGPEGGLATLIRNRRLEELRRHLGSPEMTHSIAELAEAAGFAGIDHASRAFLERYAVRPDEYRAIVTAGTGTDALFKMRFWQEEVR